MVSGECSTAEEVRYRLKDEEGVEVSASTVRRALRRNGLVGRVKVKKPLHRRKHREARLAFARRHRDWTHEDWERVIWSDETKFQIFVSDGREYCWRKPGEPLWPNHMEPTVKHGGGSIMVWDA